MSRLGVRLGFPGETRDNDPLPHPRRPRDGEHLIFSAADGLWQPGLRVAGGTVTVPEGLDKTVATGLSVVTSVVATLETISTDAAWVSAVVGDQAGTPDAGSIVLTTWSLDEGSPGLSGDDAVVNWIAFGS